MKGGGLSGSSAGGESERALAMLPSAFVSVGSHLIMTPWSCGEKSGSALAGSRSAGQQVGPQQRRGNVASPPETAPCWHASL